MIRHALAALGVAAVLAAAPFACAQTAAAPVPLAPNDYANPANWLCRPGAKANACETDLTTTVVRADGSMTAEPFKADPRASIDCFYVYPTVSTDPGVLAIMAAGPAEIQVIKQQFARFGASCRLYAPLYRQFTLTGMIAAMTGHPLPGSSPRPITPYTDVRDAWNYYLAHDNNGRGVVLIGHSQGSGMLTAQCVSTPTFNYLAIHVGGDPNGPRAKDINGDVYYGGRVMADWGLHLIDANLTVGNLIDIVAEEGKAFVRGAP